MNIDETEAYIDGFISAILPALTGFQSAFFAGHSRYWQGLPTHTATPEHSDAGVALAHADNLEAKPGCEEQNWPYALPMLVTTPVPVCLGVDRYSGLNGQGWVLRTWFSFDGVQYERTHNFGPEADRETGWVGIGD